MRYISLFSGIGGLESKNIDPLILCEKDENCIRYLKNKYKKVDVIDDVKKLLKNKIELPKVDVVSGGWPCQDISVAGQKKGFDGENSVLFFDLLAVANKSKAETIVAENVPNLLNLNHGKLFAEVLSEFQKKGYKYISWRTINTRSFNIPHQRRRLFIVASKSQQIARNLFNKIKVKIKKPKLNITINSFYHTAGTHSICFSKNYVPTIKVSGTAPSIQYQNVIRRLTPKEAISLQGFNVKEFKGISDTQIYAMAGNAVSKPVGNFIFKSLQNDFKDIDSLYDKFIQSKTRDMFGDPVTSIKNGYAENGTIHKAYIDEPELCSNLSDFIDLEENSFLSAKAISGILRRASKASKPIEKELLDVMLTIEGVRDSLSENDIKKVSSRVEKIYQPNDTEEELNFN